LSRQGAILRVIAPHGGTVSRGRRQEIVERTFLTARSIEFDAVIVAGGTASEQAPDLKVQILLQEAFRHCKSIAAWGDGESVLAASGISTEAPGVLVADSVNAAFSKELLAALGLHRAWDRTAVLMTPAG
jgi:catalase